MKKKLLAVLLSVLLLCTMLPLGALSVSAATYQGWIYEVNNGEATITGLDNWSPYSVTVPNTIAGYPVTAIGDEAFSDSDNTRYIYLPNTLKTIGKKSFWGLTNLISVAIPDGVITIGEDAFSYTGIRGVSIPKSVTSIGKRAFYYCRTLKTAIISNGVNVIEDGTFSYCTNLQTITLSNNISSIGVGAFNSCSALAKVYYAGSEIDFEKIVVENNNNYLLNAKRYYHWMEPADLYSDVVTHSVMDTENGNGLAFRFELKANTIGVSDGNVVDCANATVYYYGTACKLIGMGAVLTNDAESASALTLDNVNDFTVLDVPAVYLQELNEDSCAFAVRIINIPDEQLERTIYARPYYIVEVDGEQITVYSDVDAASCAEYM